MKIHLPFSSVPHPFPFVLPQFLAPFVAAAALAVPWIARANMTTERFWLENMVSREISGPVVRQTGHRFQIGSQGYVVLDSEPGKIRLATYPQGDPFGPYDIVESRIIDIGQSAAFSIVNIQKADVPELPPDLSGLVGVYVKGEQKAPPPPEPEWEPIPLAEWPLRVGGWLDLFHSTDYDWKVGGHAGKKSLDLKSSRIGARLDWGYAFFQLGLVTDGKQSGSITPDLVAIESLGLRNGSGFSLSGGYLQPFFLAEGWEALVGGEVEMSMESYDLVARTLKRTESAPKAEEGTDGESDAATGAQTYSYEYQSTTSTLDFREFLARLSLGLRFSDYIWGASGLLCIDVVSNVNADGSVSVNGESLSLDAERTHPIGVEFGAWCYLLDQLRADATLRLGATQLLRLGLSWEW